MKRILTTAIPLVAAAIGAVLLLGGCKPTGPSVTGVSLSPATLTLTEGSSQKLSVTISPADAANKTVSWSSANPSVATVSDGVVTGVASGQTSITVRSEDGGKSASCAVTVTPKTVDVTSVTLDKSSLSLEIGAEATLSATVLPDNATDKTVTWSSSAADVATVADGRVKAVAEGKAVIKASAGGKEATCEVTVTVPVVYVEYVSVDIYGDYSFTVPTPLAKSGYYYMDDQIVHGARRLNLGEDDDIPLVKFFSFYPEDATDKSIRLKSSNPDVISIADGGVLKVKSEGVALIGYVAGGAKEKEVGKMGMGLWGTIPIVVVKRPQGAVDLGTEVFWAGSNYGASTPSGLGNLYSFGETETKSQYTPHNYKWAGYDPVNWGSGKGIWEYGLYLTKYNPSENHGIVDNKMDLDPEDDVIMQKVGTPWRMPYADELKQIIGSGSIKWTLTDVDGLAVYELQGIATLEKMYLPFLTNGTGDDRGRIRGRDLTVKNNEWGYSEPYTLYYYRNEGYVGAHGNINTHNSRYEGFPVRGVAPYRVEAKDSERSFGFDF